MNEKLEFLQEVLETKKDRELTASGSDLNMITRNQYRRELYNEIIDLIKVIKEFKIGGKET
jgi:hypothetical protein